MRQRTRWLMWLLLSLSLPLARSTLDMADAARSFQSFTRSTHSPVYDGANTHISRSSASTAGLSSSTIEHLSAVELTVRHPGRAFAPSTANPDRVGSGAPPHRAKQRHSAWARESTDANDEPAATLLSQYDAARMGTYRAEREEVEPFLRQDSNAVGFNQLAVGFKHLCGLDKSSRKPWCLGDNAKNQATPPAGVAMSEVAMGVHHSCGIGLSDGHIHCWGENNVGQSNPPTAAAAAAAHAVGDGSSFTAAQASFHGLTLGFQHSCALDQEGHAHCWGNPGNGRTMPPDPGATFSSLAAGYHHTCGVLQGKEGKGRPSTAGVVVCWGSNSDGQTSSPAEGMSALCAGFKHSCGVRESDGSVMCWGRNHEGQCDAFENSTRIVGRALDCGYKHTCVLKTGAGGAAGEFGEGEGELVCFGDNSFGQSEAPRGRFASLTVGGAVGCALKFGEKFPAGGRHPAYPMQGETALCWGDLAMGGQGGAESTAEVTGSGQQLGRAAYGDWLFFLPRTTERHYQ